MDDRRRYHVHARRVDTPSLALGINHFTYRHPRSLQGALSEIEGRKSPVSQALSHSVSLLVISLATPCRQFDSIPSHISLFLEFDQLQLCALD